MDLEQAIQVTKKEWETDPQLRKDRDEVISKYGKIFNLENIDNLTAEKFQGFLRYKNNKHWDRIQRPGGSLVKDMNKLKNALKILLDENLSLSNRIKQIRDKESPNYTPFLANAIYTPILLVTNPKKYPVVNEPVAEALEQLGLYSYKDYVNDWDWITIPKMQQIILEVAKKNNLDIWQIDWVWWKIARPESRQLPIALCWSVDDPSKIDIFQTIISQKGKSFWGVNWSPSRLTKDDYPLTGYINYKRQIIAKGAISSIIPDEVYQTLKEKDRFRIPQADYDPQNWKNFVEFGKLEKIENPFPLNSLKLYFEKDKPVPENLQNKIYVEDRVYHKDSMEDDINYWKIAPGEGAYLWDEQRTNNVIAIHWNDLGNLKNQSFDEVHKKLKELWPHKIAVLSPQFRDFLSIKKGDIIIANKGFSRIVGIGRVVGDYQHRPDLTFHHTYPVEWFDVIEKEIPSQGVTWRKTVYRVTPEQYQSIISPKEENFLLLRHNPPSKRTKTDRKYWDDVLGKEYHFGKTVPNYTKVIPGSKTVWFYTDKNDLFFWGNGYVDQLKNIDKDHFIAAIKDFKKFSDESAVKASIPIQEKIKSLSGWNPYNSIIEIDNTIYDEIVGKREEHVYYLTPEDFEKFLNAIPMLREFQPHKYHKSALTAQQYQLGYRLLYGSALNITELIHLRVKDLDLENHLIKVGDDKSDFPYATILPNDIPLLKEYISTMDKNEQLFPLDRSVMWRYAKDAGNLLGLKIFQEKMVTKVVGLDLLIFRQSIAKRMELNGARDGLIRLKLRKSFSDAAYRYDIPAIQDLKEWELKNSEKIPEIMPQVKPFEDVPLEPVSEQDMRTGYEELSQELLIPEKKVTEIVTALASGSHVILAGPIGTGKTELARKIPQIFWKKNGGYYSDVFTATADWNTQDIIGGIVPKMEDKKVVYKIQDGCVTESVRKNWSGSSRRHYGEYHGVWTIIDEFNRADIDKAFGQLFTSLRTKELKIPSDLSEKNYEELKIPNDYRIIGTLNTADKHYLFPLSNALKSRFAFIEIDIPSEDQYQQEIYYAIKNALNTFGPEYSSLVNLDHKHRTLNTKDGTEFEKIVFQAYNFLAFVRLYKKLGTAILKILIQNLLTGIKMSINLNEVLDNTLNSTIIPQLEGLSEIEFGSIKAISNNELVKFFKDISKTNKRHTSWKVFSKTMEFLKLNPKDYEYFIQRELKDDDKLWDEINAKFSQKQQILEKTFPSNLEQVNNSLDSLIDQSII